jgi:hypothetical protein
MRLSKSQHSELDNSQLETHTSTLSGFPSAPQVFQLVTPASGVSPAEIGIDLRHNSASTSPLNVFITASLVTRDVTLRASGPRH